jgi:heterodisulfide reductase subunit B
MRFAFFKGCFIPIRLPYIELVASKVLGDLSVELQPIEGFSCCPEPVGFLTDRFTGLTISARNIALAEEEGRDIVTLCNGCTYSLRQANLSLKKNSELRDRVNDVLAETGHQFKGSIEVKHFAQVLTEDIGIEKIEALVRKPLSGVRVACHTGCHILSPPEAMAFDDPLDPVVLERMVSALGAEPVDYELKTLCCGWTLTNYGDKESANRLVGTKLNLMHGAAADCLAVICPQCFYQFDTGQMLAARELKLDYKLPVLFYLQLLALAMGYNVDEIQLSMHRVKDQALEEKLRRLTA